VKLKRSKPKRMKKKTSKKKDASQEWETKHKNQSILLLMRARAKTGMKSADKLLKKYKKKKLNVN
jgi:hypothetical protein